MIFQIYKQFQIDLKEQDYLYHLIFVIYTKTQNVIYTSILLDIELIYYICFHIFSMKIVDLGQ